MNKTWKKIYLAILVIVLCLSIGCTCNLAGNKVYLNCYGNILPCANNIYTLGDNTLLWNYIYTTNIATNSLIANGNVDIGGDLVFTNGGAGLPYGGIYSNTTGDVVCTLQNVWYQIPFDVVGVSNLTTVSIANDDITILKTGDYMVSICICKHSHFANDYEYQVFINNGATPVNNITIHETTLPAGKEANSAQTALTSFTAGDTVELWVRCIDAAGKTISIDNVDMNVTMVGR